MGKVQVGILDGFIGKVGTVVGSYWKTKPVMRAYKRTISDRNSEAQQLVRTRFGAIGRLAGTFHNAISTGLFNIARSRHMTEGDIFVRENWGCVHSDTPGTATFDYSDMVIAMGNLPEAQFGTLSFADPLKVTVPMTDTSDVVGASSDDLIYLVVYSPEADAIVMAVPTTRDNQGISATVPAYWNGHRVHVWGFAVGDGVDNDGVRSKSNYLGSGTIS